MALPALLAAAPSFLGGAGDLFSSFTGGGGAAGAPVSVPQSSAASAGPTNQTQTTAFGSSFAVGGGGATAGAPSSSFLPVAGGVAPWITLALVGAAVVAAVVFLRRA